MDTALRVFGWASLIVFVFLVLYLAASLVWPRSSWWRSQLHRRLLDYLGDPVAAPRIREQNDRRMF